MRSVSRTICIGARAALSIAAFAAVVSTAACSGGGSSGSPATPAGPAPSATPSSNTASVTFKIVWPAATASSAARGRTPQVSASRGRSPQVSASRGRRPHYLPATALSASISVNGGVAQYINSPTSTLTFPAPVGLDTFLVQAYDEPNGQGDVLSRADITQTVSGSTANVVSATLNGVIASLSVVLSTYTTPAGALRNVAVAVNGLDAEGNTIVGPADYNTPISLAIVDPANSGTLSITKKLFVGPSTAATLTYSGGSLVSASIVASANGVPPASVTFAPTPTFYQYADTKPNNLPGYIAAGPDGNMWFTDLRLNTIVRITPTGTMTSFTTPTPNSEPYGIIAASDGRLWFTESNASQIGAVTTTGTFSEYATAKPNDDPIFLVDRGDGNIWYTGSGNNDIGLQPLSGATGSSLGSVPTNDAAVDGIAVAPSKLVYFTETFGNNIGYVTSGELIGEIPLPTAGATPRQMVAGPDGNLWFTEPNLSSIGVFNPQSQKVIAEYPTPSAGSYPLTIVAGKDGALWFTEQALNRIGRVTTAGVVTEYQIPGFTVFLPEGIGVAADGSLWICEEGDGGGAPGEIVRFVY